jgi:uncharacterized glyoxalase superfamily protein PhnB
MAKAIKRAKPRTRKAKPVAAGFHTVTPHIILDDCAKAIEFYQKAFGAKEKVRHAVPGGKIAHAEIRVGDSIVMMSDEMPPMPGQAGVYLARRGRSPPTSKTSPPPR